MKKLTKTIIALLIVLAMPIATYASSLTSSYSSSSYKSTSTTEERYLSELSTEERESYNKLSSSSDFNILTYDIKMKVNLDNTFDITEDLVTYFYSNKHGIKRNIPVKNTVLSTSGETTNRAKISNIVVSDQFTTESENGELILKIGSASSYVRGRKAYTIKYRYDLGKDRFSGFDELYYNIVGTGWTCKIGKVKFSIEMPAEFDKTKLGFSTGSRGFSGYESKDLQYEVVGNTITGTYTGTLLSGQGITVRCELPENYFAEAKDTMSTQIIVRSIIIAIATILGIVVWAKIGKDEPIVETVEFYPPKGMNSLEVGYFYKEGKAEKKDVVSLLIYLASKGYIRIEELEEESLLTKKKTYQIVKVKDYNGKNPQEREFFNGLFKSGDTVTKTDLQNKFYRTVDTIVSDIRKNNKESVWTKESTTKRWWIALAIVVIFLTTITGDVTSISELISGVGDFIMVGFAAVSFWPIWFIIAYGMKNRLGRGVTISIVGAIAMIAASASTMEYTPSYGIVVLLGIAGLATSMIMFNIATKRTKEQTERLGKIRGFKNFLETAEKEKLEALVEDDPQYFYNILPFTYVLGVSDKWIKKFEDITLEEPDWYKSNTGVYDYMMFNHFLNSTYRSITTNMTSAPSSSGSSGGGGGGFSGGGFSGGGSGGGGGSSW